MITYTATNTLNGKFYIGSTTNLEQRKKEHLNSKVNYPFQNALRRNPEAFVWDYSEDGSDEPEFEQALLDVYFGTKYCYNLNPFSSRPPSCVGWTGKLHPMFGKKNPGGSEARKKITGELHSSSKKLVVTYPDGTEQIFGSISEAGKLLGHNHSHLSNWAKNNHTPLWGKFKGYTFTF